MHYLLFDSRDRADVYKCECDFTLMRDINERSRGQRKIFVFLTNTSVKCTAYYINPLCPFPPTPPPFPFPLLERYGRNSRRGAEKEIR